MTEIIFKIGVFAILVTVLTVFLNAQPDAQALPQGFKDGINWIFTKMYSFDFIIPVADFFVIVFSAIKVIAGYFAILFLKMLLRLIHTSS